eukprot:534774_1
MGWFDVVWIESLLVAAFHGLYPILDGWPLTQGQERLVVVPIRGSLIRGSLIRGSLVEAGAGLVHKAPEEIDHEDETNDAHDHLARSECVRVIIRLCPLTALDYSRLLRF